MLAGFVDEGHVFTINPVEGPEGLARHKARQRLEEDLGAHRYQDARARGAQLSYEAFIDYSLRELDLVTDGAAER